MTLLFGASQRECISYMNRHHMDRSKTRIISRAEDLYGYIHGTPLVFLQGHIMNPESLAVMTMAAHNDLMTLIELKNV